MIIGRNKIQSKRREPGFTVVELLIVLIISSILLTALAVALQASIFNYKENEDIFNTVNSARQALFRMTSQLRTGYYVDPNAPSNECSFYTADGSDITYQYTDPNLYVITNSDGEEYLLCKNVTSMSFVKTPTDDGTDCKSVQIFMTVEAGDFEQAFSAASVIRKNLD